MMLSKYSIIKIITNLFTNEYVAIGMVAISGGQGFYHVSEEKVKLAKKSIPDAKEIIDLSIQQFNQAFSDFKDKGNLFVSKDLLNERYLERLSVYNNGIIQVTRPASIQIEFDASVFKSYFEKFVGEFEVVKKLTEVSQFAAKLKKNLYEPLKDKIDVDYTLKKGVLPTLFNDFKLDTLGVNGSMYASKSIDFNGKRSVADIRNEMSLYESTIERLKNFGHSKLLKNEHRFYLIADEYKGKTPSYNELYALLENNKMPFFELVSSNDSAKIIDEINTNKVSKFSSFIESV